MKDKIRVVELFAGVGGFRLGLEGWLGASATSGYQDLFESAYRVVWSNQFEPGASIQLASQVYQYHWGQADHITGDIHQIATDPKLIVPGHDMLVGGFPCQDYSVANTLRNSKGIEGKKGVLWWDIHEILYRFLEEESEPTKYLLLENVDRLLKSPVQQRGRDFAIMLASLSDLGYIVEWRVINAADYGMPQRRRRIFILAYHENTPLGKTVLSTDPGLWMTYTGVVANAFPVLKGTNLHCREVEIKGKPHEITANFNAGSNRFRSPFDNAGIFVGRTAYTKHLFPTPLTAALKEGMALERYLDTETDLAPFEVDEEIVFDKKKGWAFHKGSKSKKRTDPKTGFEYEWSEGSMSLIDDLKKPARTIITSEGGSSPSRSKHLIKPNSGPFRRLTPLELERVSMFPDNHTRYRLGADLKVHEVLPANRAFFMGNALVVGVVERLGVSLSNAIMLNSIDRTKEAAYEVSV